MTLIFWFDRFWFYGCCVLNCECVGFDLGVVFKLSGF